MYRTAKSLAKSWFSEIGGNFEVLEENKLDPIWVADAVQVSSLFSTKSGNRNSNFLRSEKCTSLGCELGIFLSPKGDGNFTSSSYGTKIQRCYASEI